jgi:hypothetical protein
MVDRYTKIVLTVIAATLVGLLAVRLTPVAHAQTDPGCGTYPDPCYIKAQEPLPVDVQSMPHAF